MAMKLEPRERIAEMAKLLSDAADTLWRVSGRMEKEGPPALRIQLATVLTRAQEIMAWTVRIEAEQKVQKDQHARAIAAATEKRAKMEAQGKKKS